MAAFNPVVTVASGGEPTSRRAKVLHLDPGLFADLLRLDGSKRIRLDGLPADARLIAVSDKCLANVFSFVIESTEFPEVRQGDVFPELTLTVSEISSPLMGREFI